MRTITNEANLPIPMYNALSADTYVGGGDISVTRLISPPRIVTLRKFHEDEIREDASERIWMLLGNAIHHFLEHSAGDRHDIIVETRLHMTIEGWDVSGQPDVYQVFDRTLFDYKVTSVWAVLFGKPEWEKQVNLQAMLHRNKGDLVDGGNIMAVLRDWQHSKAKYEKDYPQVACKKIPVPMWTQQEALDYAARRVRLHQKAQADYKASNFDVNVLPECTDDEKWYRGQKFCVKKMDDPATLKPGKESKINKKSDRVFDNLADAKEYMEKNAINLPKKKVYAPVEVRPGEYIRCMRYCDVWFKCPFGTKLRQSLVNEKTAANDSDEEDVEATLFGD
jgi:hypothetical protein